jgi:hypothetical protein
MKCEKCRVGFIGVERRSRSDSHCNLKKNEDGM